MPRGTSAKFEEVFNAALKARCAGDVENALELCGRALEQGEGVDNTLLAAAHGECAHICMFLLVTPDINEAERHFKAATQLVPKSELASMGLFHALVELGRWRDALEEIVRLVSLRDSPEYRELLSDEFGADLDDPLLQQLIERARALLAHGPPEGDEDPDRG